MAPTFETVSTDMSFPGDWGLGTAIDNFKTEHPFLFYSAALLYLCPVAVGLIALLLFVRPRDIPWLHPIFLTDGVLICCCPLAAVLPVILWPLMLIMALLGRALRWFLAAPTFCGIRRNTIRLYATRLLSLPIVAGSRAWHTVVGLFRSRRKVHQPLLPAERVPPSTPPYGSMGTSRGSFQTRQHNPPGPRGARSPTMQSDARSTRFAPPPYEA